MHECHKMAIAMAILNKMAIAMDILKGKMNSSGNAGRQVCFHSFETFICARTYTQLVLHYMFITY